MERLPEFVSNHLFLATLFIVILGLLIWNLFNDVVTGVRKVSTAEATRMMNHDKAVVLDVRSSTEFASGHVLNALNIPDSEIKEREKEIQKYKQQPLIVCCSNGMSSMRTARLLKTQGFEQVCCLNGGLQAWQSANLPLTRTKS